MRDVDFSHLEQTELAYAAGLIDGEGCVGIVKFFQGGWGPYYTLRLRVSMTHKPTVMWLKNTFGGSFHKRKDARGNRKDTYTVGWSDARGRSVLRSIYPYLKTKKQQADVALALEATRISKGNDGKRTDAVVAKQAALCARMHGLNKRGLTPA